MYFRVFVAWAGAALRRHRQVANLRRQTSGAEVLTRGAGKKRHRRGDPARSKKVTELAKEVDAVDGRLKAEGGMAHGEIQQRVCGERLQARDVSRRAAGGVEQAIEHIVSASRSMGCPHTKVYPPLSARALEKRPQLAGRARWL